jgi:hypothetical protein
MTTKKQLTEVQLGRGADFRTQRFDVTLPEGHTLQDLFDPVYWAQCVTQNRLGQFDLIRVRAADGSFDCTVTVVAVLKGAARVELWPKMPADAAEMMQPRAKSVVPIAWGGNPRCRVEEVGGVVSDAKRFRVLAINGEELSRHGSRGEAEAAHAAYLDSLHMRMPNDREIAEAVAKMETEEARRTETQEARRVHGKGKTKEIA